MRKNVFVGMFILSVVFLAVDVLGIGEECPVECKNLCSVPPHNELVGYVCPEGYQICCGESNIDLEVPIIYNSYTQEDNFAHIPLTIKNNQDVEDTVELSISSDGRAAFYSEFSDNYMTIPPMGSVDVGLLIAPFSGQRNDGYTYVVEVVSLEDVREIDSEYVGVNIGMYYTPPNVYHYQPYLCDSGSYSCHVSSERIGVNFYLNPKLADGGYTVKNNGSVCVGDTVSVDDEDLSGEWFEKGGIYDTPPIQWVQDIDIVKEQIHEGTFEAETYESWVRSSALGANPYKVFGALVCSKGCKITDFGDVQKVTDKTFKIVDEGSIEIEVICPVECIFFIDTYCWNAVSYRCDRPEEVSIYRRLDYPVFEISKTIEFDATKGQKPPDLDIRSFNQQKISDGESLYVRIVVKNKGEMDAILDAVSLNVPYKVLYMSATLMPGEEDEIIIEAQAEILEQLKFTVDYRSDKIGCLSVKEFSETFDLGNINVVEPSRCRVDSDCPAEEFGLTTMRCCVGVCRDLTRGACDDFDGDGTFEWSNY